MKTLFTMLLVSGVLVGCATQPKPERKIVQHSELAKSIYMNKQCTAKGYMPPDIGALGERYIKAIMGQYPYDENRITVILNTFVGTQVTKEDCNLLAMQIVGKKQSIDEQNAFNQQQATEWQNTINNRPTQTYCNKIGTQLFCNTY